jgi:sterol desaturase/sphingolipid hydroxylase (fatty acid hydroxylase superfamily)
MFISIASLYNFVVINGILVSVGCIQYICTSTIVFPIFVARNVGLLKMIEWNIASKPFVQPRLQGQGQEQTQYILWFSLCTTTLIETMTHTIILSSSFLHPQSLLFFIPKSFLFEVVFDLFHYTMHRSLHWDVLYSLHKQHHRYNHPEPIHTFYQNPIDLILTNSIPTLLTLFLLQRTCGVSFSELEYNILTVYKIYIEIGGHSGKRLYPTSCFAQFVWLPKWLGIELYSEDHDTHHSLHHCNYGKRFSLWDKVFGTFVHKKIDN